MILYDIRSLTSLYIPYNMAIHIAYCILHISGTSCQYFNLSFLTSFKQSVPVYLLVASQLLVDCTMFSNSPSEEIHWNGGNLFLVTCSLLMIRNKLSPPQKISSDRIWEHCTVHTQHVCHGCKWTGTQATITRTSMLHF